MKRKEPAVIAIDTTESIAAQFLGLLLDGHRVDRKSALTTELGKSGWNQSLHVLANYLRWTRLIPVESDMEENHPRATYWMTPTEIRRFRDPVGRLEQEAEMLAERTAKRLRNNAKSVQRLAALVRECPDDARRMHSVLREATDELTRAVLSL